MKYRVLLITHKPGSDVPHVSEVVGAIEYPSVFCGAMNFMADGQPQCARFEAWFIDPETNEPIMPTSVDGRDAHVLSTRLERFLILQNPDLVGKVPGWIFRVPKRIIDLG